MTHLLFVCTLVHTKRGREMKTFSAKDKRTQKLHLIRSTKAHVTILCLVLLAGCFGVVYAISTAFEEVGSSITIPGFHISTR